MDGLGWSMPLGGSVLAQQLLELGELHSCVQDTAMCQRLASAVPTLYSALSELDSTQMDVAAEALGEARCVWVGNGFQKPSKVCWHPQLWNPTLAARHCWPSATQFHPGCLRPLPYCRSPSRGRSISRPGSMSFPSTSRPSSTSWCRWESARNSRRGSSRHSSRRWRRWRVRNRSLQGSWHRCARK